MFNFAQIPPLSDYLNKFKAGTCTLYFFKIYFKNKITPFMMPIMCIIYCLIFAFTYDLPYYNGVKNLTLLFIGQNYCGIVGIC